MTAHRKSCRRWNDAGHAHVLTFSCFQRQPLLSKDRSRQWLLTGIERARVKHAFDLWAYVIMPEHVHLLILPSLAEYSISAILKTIKQSVARQALLFVRQQAPEFLVRMEDKQPNGQISYRFWQLGGGYDRNLPEPKAVWQTLDYIHANPVRRNLCKYAVDWPWSSALEWQQPGTGLPRVDRESFPRTELG
jgi:putative transposase